MVPSDEKHPLTFSPFYPEKDERERNFSGLVSLVKGMSSFIKESKGAEFAFIRGSTVSSYDLGINKAHKDSDIDVEIGVDKPHRFINQYKEQVTIDGTLILISVDITGIPLHILRMETLAEGEDGLISMSDMVQDSFCIQNEEEYKSYRNDSLLSFLRLGLLREPTVEYATPSGAMKLINDGRLMMNPLRWWSIRYAFQDSPRAANNVSRYYKDVQTMLEKYEGPVSATETEMVYHLPSPLDKQFNLKAARRAFFLSKLEGRLHSSPMYSTNDFRKVKNKFITLYKGVYHGLTTVDRVISPSGSKI